MLLENKYPMKTPKVIILTCGMLLVSYHDSLNAQDLLFHVDSTSPQPLHFVYLPTRALKSAFSHDQRRS